jgi:ADP-ribose pyrophosphatase
MTDKDKDKERLTEKTLSSEVVFSGRVFDTIVKKVMLSNGSTSTREIVKHNGGACILPVDDDLNCYMVRQFRSPFEKILLEVPAGKIEIGEDPKVCAVRELHEETGFEASEVIDLGKMICSPGYDSEIIYLYAARGLTFIGEKPDEGEFLNCEKIPLQTLVEMADRGEISDSKTQICIYKTVRRLGIEF